MTLFIDEVYILLKPNSRLQYENYKKFQQEEKVTKQKLQGDNLKELKKEGHTPYQQCLKTIFLDLLKQMDLNITNFKLKVRLSYHKDYFEIRQSYKLPILLLIMIDKIKITKKIEHTQEKFNFISPQFSINEISIHLNDDILNGFDRENQEFLHHPSTIFYIKENIIFDMKLKDQALLQIIFKLPQIQIAVDPTQLAIVYTFIQYCKYFDEKIYFYDCRLFRQEALDKIKDLQQNSIKLAFKPNLINADENIQLPLDQEQEFSQSIFNPQFTNEQNVCLDSHYGDPNKLIFNPQADFDINEMNDFLNNDQEESVQGDQATFNFGQDTDGLFLQIEFDTIYIRFFTDEQSDKIWQSAKYRCDGQYFETILKMNFLKIKRDEENMDLKIQNLRAKTYLVISPEEQFYDFDDEDQEQNMQIQKKSVRKIFEIGNGKKCNPDSEIIQQKSNHYYKRYIENCTIYEPKNDFLDNYPFLDLELKLQQDQGHSKIFLKDGQIQIAIIKTYLDQEIIKVLQTFYQNFNKQKNSITQNHLIKLYCHQLGSNMYQSFHELNLISSTLINQQNRIKLNIRNTLIYYGFQKQSDSSDNLQKTLQLLMQRITVESKYNSHNFQNYKYISMNTQINCVLEKLQLKCDNDEIIFQIHNNHQNENIFTGIQLKILNQFEIAQQTNDQFASNQQENERILGSIKSQINGFQSNINSIINLPNNYFIVNPYQDPQNFIGSLSSSIQRSSSVIDQNTYSNSQGKELELKIGVPLIILRKTEKLKILIDELQPLFNQIKSEIFFYSDFQQEKLDINNSFYYLITKNIRQKSLGYINQITYNIAFQEIDWRITENYQIYLMDLILSCQKLDDFFKLQCMIDQILLINLDCKNTPYFGRPLKNSHVYQPQFTFNHQLFNTHQVILYRHQYQDYSSNKSFWNNIDVSLHKETINYCESLLDEDCLKGIIPQNIIQESNQQLIFQIIYGKQIKIHLKINQTVVRVEQLLKTEFTDNLITYYQALQNRLLQQTINPLIDVQLSNIIFDVLPSYGLDFIQEHPEKLEFNTQNFDQRLLQFQFYHDTRSSIYFNHLKFCTDDIKSFKSFELNVFNLQFYFGKPIEMKQEILLFFKLNEEQDKETFLDHELLNILNLDNFKMLYLAQNNIDQQLSYSVKNEVINHQILICIGYADSLLGPFILFDLDRHLTILKFPMNENKCQILKESLENQNSQQFENNIEPPKFNTVQIGNNEYVIQSDSFILQDVQQINYIQQDFDFRYAQKDKLNIISLLKGNIQIGQISARFINDYPKKKGITFFKLEHQNQNNNYNFELNNIQQFVMEDYLLKSKNAFEQTNKSKIQASQYFVDQFYTVNSENVELKFQFLTSEGQNQIQSCLESTQNMELLSLPYESLTIGFQQIKVFLETKKGQQNLLEFKDEKQKNYIDILGLYENEQVVVLNLESQLLKDKKSYIFRADLKPLFVQLNESNLDDLLTFIYGDFIKFSAPSHLQNKQSNEPNDPFSQFNNKYSDQNQDEEDQDSFSFIDMDNSPDQNDLIHINHIKINEFSCTLNIETSRQRESIYSIFKKALIRQNEMSNIGKSKITTKQIATIKGNYKIPLIFVPSQYFKTTPDIILNIIQSMIFFIEGVKNSNDIEQDEILFVQRLHSKLVNMKSTLNTIVGSLAFKIRSKLLRLNRQVRYTLRKN